MFDWNVWSPRKNRKSTFGVQIKACPAAAAAAAAILPLLLRELRRPPRPPPWTNKLRLGVQSRAKMRCPRAASTPPPLGSLLHSPSSTSWHSPGPVSQASSSAVAAQTCHKSGEGFEGSGMSPNVAGNNGIAQQWQPLEANMATLMRTHCTSHLCHQPSPAAQQLPRLLFSKTKAVSPHAAAAAAACRAWGAATMDACLRMRCCCCLLHAACSCCCTLHVLAHMCTASRPALSPGSFAWTG